jgi:dGTPase
MDFAANLRQGLRGRTKFSEIIPPVTTKQDKSFTPRHRPVAAYGLDVTQSRGRLVEEPESNTRSAYQRDRDRILHSTAFRRLKHKTQVFVAHEGDHYRTRLTHSLEVSQIARSIARMLGLDEDLAEALSLAHDLGHTPFGHAGEQAIDTCMSEYGGFDHNAQTLRIVTGLERHYADFDGLNLTWETLEGLIKHNGPLLDAAGKPLPRFESQGLPEIFAEQADLRGFDLGAYASAEAQAAAAADDIAYNAHDIDDGLRAGLFDIIDLADVPVAGEILSEMLARHRDLERGRLAHEIVRRLINRMVENLLGESQKRLAAGDVTSADDVRGANRPLIAFSTAMERQNDALKKFLNARMYSHEKVVHMMIRAQRVLSDLFEAYLAKPELLPVSWRPVRGDGDRTALARHVCDFIAGMTDRFALYEHRRLFGLEPQFG